MPDLPAAAAFLATHARLLDRRRHALLLDAADPAFVLAALAAYANDDGGYGWGLEPDQRAPSSQPAGALHALWVLAETPPGSALAAPLCDWLDAATLPDGGLPFSVAGAVAPGTAPWWAAGDPQRSSLHITAAMCAAGQRLAATEPVVAAHRWLRRATDFCRDQIAALDAPGGGYELLFALQLLDALGDAAELERLGAWIPASGALPITGGIEGEAVRPLQLAPRPEGPLHALLDPAVVAADLDRLAAGQDADGGWHVDFRPVSPAAQLEWRGHATVEALETLRAYGRL